MSAWAKPIIKALSLVGLGCLVLVGLLLLVVGAMLTRTMDEGTWLITESCKLGKTSAYKNAVYCEQMAEHIPVNVIRVGWDNAFIVAMTHPSWTDPKYPECIHCFHNEATTYWWTIDLKNKALYGPMTSEQEFTARKNLLGIGNIPLWTVHEARTHATRL